MAAAPPLEPQRSLLSPRRHGSPQRYESILPRILDGTLSSTWAAVDFNSTTGSAKGSEFTHRSATMVRNSVQSGSDTSKTDLGNAMVAEATAKLAQRAKQRHADTMLWEVRTKMKPPPPMTMAELMHHPLAKEQTRKRKQKDQELGQDDEEEEEEKLPFIPKMLQNRDVMKRLLGDISTAEEHINATKNERHRFTSQLTEFLPHPPNSARSGGEREKVSWVSSPRQQTAAASGSATSRTFHLTQTSMTSTQGALVPSSSGVQEHASPLSVRALGPEHDAQILHRDPKELKKLRNEDRHTQYYRAHTLDLAMPQKVTGDTITNEDVKLFVEKLRRRDHLFNEASLNEMDRAKAAQAVFIPHKQRGLDQMLESEHMAFASMDYVFRKLRQGTNAAARKKDNGARLDVFFDHLDRLERFSIPSFPEREVQNLLRCIQKAREVVEECKGMQEYEHFSIVVNEAFAPEQLLQYYVVDFLHLLACIFGIGAEKFRWWLREMLKQFEARDYEPIFRSVERSIGKEVSKEARFRMTVHSCRGIMTDARPAISIRINVERHTVTTTPWLTAARPVWNQAFIFQIYDEQSLINVSLLLDGLAVGEGAFSVYRYPVGKASKMWFPVSGPTMPHAEVSLTAEVLAQTHGKP